MTNKEKTTQSKDSILKLLSSNVESIFAELDKVLSDIETNKGKLVQLTIEYSELDKEISDKKNDIAKQFSKLDKERSDYSDNVIKFNQDVIIFNKNKEVEERNLIEIIKKKNDAIYDIKLAEEEVRSLNLKIKSLKLLTEELSSVRTQLNETQKELDCKKEESALISSEIEKNKTSAQKELDNISQEIELKKREVLPTLTEVLTREAALKVREDNIQIIIDRYKELYADKGAGFKI